MGVPDAGRALRSAADSLTLTLTLIAQATIHPYERECKSNTGKVHEMNLHQLPWPSVVLEGLGETMVTMRVKISYLIEPNRSSRGWNGRCIHPSHGLRFATKRADEGVETFPHGIHTRAGDDGPKPPRVDTEKGWLFGGEQQ